MNKTCICCLKSVVGFVLVVGLLSIKVSYGTTWGEFGIRTHEEMEDEDLVDLNHPGLFPELMAVPRRVEEVKPEVPEPQPPQPPPTPPTVPQRPEIEEGPIPFQKFNLIQRIHFDYDKYNIKPEFVEGLKKNAEWIKNNPQYRVLIEGHCDERGSNEYNIALGERRANSTKNFLIQLGVEPDRLITKSWGEEKPLDLGKTEEAYALNRRAEFFAIRTRE